MSGNCQYHAVDLTTKSPVAQFILPELPRGGLCCDYTRPRRCVSFNILAHPDAIALQVDIRQGNGPWQSASITAGDWQLECDPIAFTGSVICLTEDRFFSITHCKPGGNTVSYRFTLIAGALSQSILPLVLNATLNYQLQTLPIRCGQV